MSALSDFTSNSGAWHRARMGTNPSHALSAAMADNNGQAYTYSNELGDKQSSDPAGCVRAPFDQWYINQQECMTGIPGGYTCNPRFINGTYDRYTPSARDSKACGGPLPPDLLPQMLNNPSIVRGQCYYQFGSLSLSVMMGGHIAVLRYTSIVNGKPYPNVVVFDQKDQVQNSLYWPMEHHYAVPFEAQPAVAGTASGIARLTINNLNGHISVSFGMGSTPCTVEWQLTNILPWQPASQASMRQ